MAESNINEILAYKFPPEGFFVPCGICELEWDHFVHTCKATDCRTPHDIHDYVPGELSIMMGEVTVEWPDGIF